MNLIIFNVIKKIIKLKKKEKKSKCVYKGSCISLKKWFYIYVFKSVVCA